MRIGDAVAWLVLAVFGTGVAAGAAWADDATACAEAAVAAERTTPALPPGLLLAIGKVESGRRDPASGATMPWPWTIDAAGSGQSFADKATAIAATMALQAAAVSSIDIGCFQINLGAHPDAFDNLDTAFDPASNGRAAARLLIGLRDQTGNWAAAIAAYHSITPERGQPYRDRVLAAWGEPAAPDAVPVLRILAWAPAGIPNGIQVWTPSIGGNGANVITIHAAGPLPIVAGQPN